MTSHNNSRRQVMDDDYSQLTTATRRDDYDDDYDGPCIIRVVAPATLEEGYTFDVLVEDEPYTVQVSDRWYP